MGMDRRRFVEVSAGLLAATVLPGCAGIAVTRLAPVDGAVRLPVRNYPQLAQPGGYLKVQAEGAPGAGVIYVLALDDRSYAAVSPICAHLGCTVNIEGPRLVCPCHGSTYDRSGGLLRGPAQRGLVRFPTTLTEGGELVIRLAGEVAS